MSDNNDIISEGLSDSTDVENNKHNSAFTLVRQKMGLPI